MSREFTFEISEEDYLGVTASAKDQFEAMHICLRTSLMSILDDSREYSEMGVVGFFANVPLEDIQRLVSLLVKRKVTRRSDEVEVAENLFSDDIQNYYLLIFYVLKENLGGFWQLRRPSAKKAAEPTP